MKRRTPALASLAVLSTAAALALSGPASAVGPVTLYANAGGAGDVCSQTDPCALGNAMTDADPGDTIIIEPGSYGTKAAPLNSEVALSSNGVTMQDQADAATPIMYSNATVGIELSDGSTLTGLVLHSMKEKGGLFVPTGASASHVTVRAPGSGFACAVSGALSDSLCVDGASSGKAVTVDDSSTTIAPSLRGVTAEATGADGLGIDVEATATSTINLKVTNVIAHGGSADVSASASTASTATATITLSHSDFATTEASGNPGTATIIGGAKNVEAAPRFASAATGDYHEASGSPTIDAGAPDPKSDTDLDGLPRTLGGAPDIGAYEAAQAPIVGKVTNIKATKATVHLTTSVNPEGLLTSVHAVATHGQSKVVSSSDSLPVGGASSTVRLGLVGLARHTKYDVSVVAKNADGSTHSQTVSVTTH